MEDDDISVSMAQKALTGVNGGASALTPETVPEPIKKTAPAAAGGGVDFSGRKLKSQMESAYDIAKRTVAGISGGMSRGPLGAFDTNTKNQLFPPVAQRPQSAWAKMGTSGLLAEFLKQQATEKIRGQQFGGVAARPQNAGAMPEIDTRPLNERMTTISPIGGGAAIPHYDYNGVMVALPDGVDANDANAVGAAMAEQNALIDMMNGVNDEED